MKEALSNWLRQDLERWLLNLAKDLAYVFMFFVISVAICSGLLYMLKALWFTYTATPTGEHFILHFGSRADAIERVLSQRLFLLSLSVNVMALKVCLVWTKEEGVTCAPPTADSSLAAFIQKDVEGP